MYNKQKILAILLGLIIVFVILAGCTQSKAPVGESKVRAEETGREKIRIAQQFGLVYAPLMIAQEKGFFEKYGLEVEWKRFGSGGAAREALASGELDAAFMGIPPFLIGWDKGVPAKVAVGYVVSPVSLVTYKSEIKSLKDFKSGDKIALPSPGSMQHILLAMAAERELGNANAFDDMLVALPHPDGCSAMLAKKDITAHFTTPPYLFEELSQQGYKEVLTGAEAFGQEFGFNVGLVTKEYHDKHPRGYASFVMGVSEAITWINHHKEEAAEILAPEFNMPKEKLYKYMTWPGLNYTTAPYGLIGFAEFMKKAGYISKLPQDISEIAWENISAFIGMREGSPSMMEQLQQRK
ncbi:MAG: sulfonate transport system substrate-binding protein [Thermosediminibacterales bacterium]|nr:sulfonate transport system substrate-binding protein [Thermosediminibacterales bacterium]